MALEIKKLAEQTSNTVNHIDQIVNDIKGKTQRVSEKANNGSQAVEEGEIKTKLVLDSFGNIKSAFETIDEYIDNELAMTGHVSTIFTQIREQSSNISNISLKHSASTEEMVAITEEQNSSIGIIYESISNINISSIRLQELIEKRNDVIENNPT